MRPTKQCGRRPSKRSLPRSLSWLPHDWRRQEGSIENGSPRRAGGLPGWWASIRRSLPGQFHYKLGGSSICPRAIALSSASVKSVAPSTLYAFFR